MKVELSENIKTVRCYLNQVISFHNFTAKTIVLQFGKMKLVLWYKKTIKMMKMEMTMMVLLIQKSICKKTFQAKINFFLLITFFKLKKSLQTVNNNNKKNSKQLNNILLLNRNTIFLLLKEYFHLVNKTFKLLNKLFHQNNSHLSRFNRFFNISKPNNLIKQLEKLQMYLKTTVECLFPQKKRF